MDEYFSSMCATTDGGFVFVGSTASQLGMVTGNHGADDYWIIKIDSVGNIQWKKCFGGTNEDIPSEVIQNNNGDLIICGYTASDDGNVSGLHNPGFGAEDMWVICINNSFGNLLWQKCVGGSDGDIAYGIIQTNDNGYLVSGSTFSTDGDAAGGGNHGNGDAWVVKLSPFIVNTDALPQPITDFTTYLTNSNLYLSFYANGNEHTQVQLLDITGRVLLQQWLAVTAGFNKQEVRVGELSAGVYMVRLVTEGPPKDGFAWAKGAVTKKLIVQ